MAVFLLQCKDERRADFSSKEISSPILETTANLPMSHFNGNLMVSNNIIIALL